ncbi:MAG: hypothetical protein ACOVOT_08325 [Rubrivivax sp.]|jgi:hypothetical protein|nr:hypothetical protein [Rubrivivax sp.]
MKSQPPAAASQPPLAPRDSDERFASTLAASRGLFDAPEAVIERAISVFAARTPQAATPDTPGLLRRIVATLRLDTALTPAASLGLRSVGGTAVRQMLFSAEGRDIDLRLMPLPPHFPVAGEARRWRLSGQVLGPDSNGQAVLRGAVEHHAVDWNELSEFSFDTSLTGPLVLTLRSGDWEIELPPIEFENPGP